MASKTEKRFAVWNIQVGRIESLHVDKKDAANAAERFVEKSGDNADDTQLEVVEFSVSVYEPAENPSPKPAATKKPKAPSKKKK